MIEKCLEMAVWNDVFYKTCFYNPLISGIYYLGGNIYPFLANDLFTYQFKDFSLYSQNIEINSLDTILKNIGIQTRKLKNNNSIDSKIIAAINAGKPVFLPIDRYYWQDKKNKIFFQKKHWPHYLLVYGYNLQLKNFYILDVKDQEWICYKNTIRFEELIACYNSYSEWKNDENNKGFILFNNKRNSLNNKNLDLKQNKKSFEINFLNHKDKIINNLKAIKEIKNYIKRNENNFFKTNLLDLNRPFTFLVPVKLVQIYRCKLFFNNQKLLSILEELIEYFTLIKTTFVKIHVIQKLEKNLVKRIFQYLDEIYKKKKKYYQLLLNMIK